MTEPLRIEGAGALDVPDDVTAREAAKLAEFLGKMLVKPPTFLMNPKMRAEFVAEEVKAHGLERLFKAEKDQG